MNAPNPIPQSFAQRLRDKDRVGDAVAQMVSDWPTLARELEGDQANLEAAFNDAAAQENPESGSAVAPAEALAIGVVRADGTVEQADPAFARWFAEAAGLSALVRRAHDEGAALGLVETGDGEMAAAWAGAGKAASRWPLSAQAKAALAAGHNRLAVVVFAPTRSDALADRAAEAFDLSHAEARLAQAILFAPSLEIAAAQIGVGRETARDTLKRIMAKAGAARLPSLLARLTELMCAAGTGGAPGETVLVQTFGVTPSEARCSALIAAGQTAKQTAEALHLSPETVKSYIKAVLAKTGLARAKDLSRLLVEARELAFLVNVRDPVFETAKTAGRLRVITTPAPEARQVAFIDYGPRSATPAVVFHGYAAGRTLPPAFVKALQAKGFRPIVPQRPGFGLTAAARGDYLTVAAADLALLLDELKAKDPVVLARDGGVAVGLAFARAYPGRVARFVLLNPRTPAAFYDRSVGIVDLITRGLLGNPKLVAPVTELLRRHADSEMVEGNLRRTCSTAPADREALEDRAVVDGLVRDIQALVARSCAGFAAEHALFANGWLPPELESGRWTVLRSGGMPETPDAPWAGLPGVKFQSLEGAGFLAQFTHAAEMAEAVAGA